MGDTAGRASSVGCWGHMVENQSGRLPAGGDTGGTRKAAGESGGPRGGKGVSELGGSASQSSWQGQAGCNGPSFPWRLRDAGSTSAWDCWPHDPPARQCGIAAEGGGRGPGHVCGSPGASGRGSAPTHSRGRCSASFPRRPAKTAPCSAARTHAGLLFHPGASPGAAGRAPGAPGGGEGDCVQRPELTCSPWARCFSSCLSARVVGSWAPFTSGKPGGIRFHRDKATKPRAGCLAL